MSDTSTTTEPTAEPEVGDPVPANCLFCAATVTVVLGPTGPTSMVAHPVGNPPAADGDDPTGGTGPACPGTNLPACTGDTHIDEFRRDALMKSVEFQHAADALRGTVVEMFTDRRALFVILDEIAQLIQAETLASRWRELARDTGLVDAVYDGVADLAAPQATAVNDAFIDCNTRIGTRTWLREVVDPIPGSMLAELVDKI